MNFEDGLPFRFSISEREMDGGGGLVFQSFLSRSTFFMNALLCVQFPLEWRKVKVFYLL